MTNPRTILKANVEAVIEGIKHLSVDDAADLLAELADEMAEGGPEDLFHGAILDGIRWGYAAAVGVEIGGGAMLRVILPGGVGITYADETFDRAGNHQFTDEEIQRQAKSVWQWTQDQIAKGTYYVGQGRYLQLSHDAIDEVLPLGADATMLFMYLKRRSDHRQSLIVANDMRKTMPDGEWTLRRFTRARKTLLDGGILKETRPASTWHGPATYAWQG